MIGPLPAEVNDDRSLGFQWVI